MGYRAVKIHLFGGTAISIMVPYYHQKSDLKKMRGRKGFYPKLLLLGIQDRYTSAICSRIEILNRTELPTFFFFSPLPFPGGEGAGALFFLSLANNL